MDCLWLPAITGIKPPLVILVPNVDTFVIQVESVITSEVCTQGRWELDDRSSGSWKTGTWKCSDCVSTTLTKMDVKLIQ